MLGIAGRGLSVLLLPLAAFVAFCLPAAGAFDWIFLGCGGRGWSDCTMTHPIHWGLYLWVDQSRKQPVG